MSKPKEALLTRTLTIGKCLSVKCFTLRGLCKITDSSAITTQNLQRSKTPHRTALDVRLHLTFLDETNNSQVHNITQPAVVGGCVVKAVTVNLSSKLKKNRSSPSRKTPSYSRCSKNTESKEDSPNAIPVPLNEVSKTLSIDTGSYITPRTAEAQKHRRIFPDNVSI